MNLDQSDLKKVVRFCIGGAIGCGAYYAALYGLTEYAGWWYVVSAMAGYILNTAISFVIQKYWTFGDQGTKTLGTQIKAYFVMNVFFFVLNALLLWLLVAHAHIWYIYAQIIVTAVITVLSYIGTQMIFDAHDKDIGRVVAIFISPAAGAAMKKVSEVEAIAHAGLKGDRYCAGKGSFSKGEIGKRQVTLINAAFFPGNGFTYAESRRNIVISGVELMWLIGREFKIGEAVFRGVKYCEPCPRPSTIACKKRSFKQAFADRGGLVAEVIMGGVIRAGDKIVPPPKEY